MSQDAFLTPPPRTALPEREAVTAPDPRIARAEERLAMLREMAEVGMALLRDLPCRSLETQETPEAAPDADATSKPTPKPTPTPRHDPTDSFARLTRAIRLTFALEAVVEDRLDALRAGKLDPAPASARPAAPTPPPPASPTTTASGTSRATTPPRSATRSVTTSSM